MASREVVELRCPVQTIVCNGKQLRTLTTECINALNLANDPLVLFVRGGSLVRLRPIEAGGIEVEALGDYELRARLTEVADFVTQHKGGEQHVYEPTDPPMNVVHNIRALTEWPFPILEAVTESPIFNADGSLLCSPGYDPSTRHFFHTSPNFNLGHVPDEPTSEDLKKSIELIEEAIGDFPFVDQTSFANAVALLITPVLRTIVPGLVPLALIDAPQAGTGKGLLTDVCAIIATGQPAHIRPYPAKEDELRKSIGSILLDCPAIAGWDNVDRKVDSPSMAAVLTAKIWSDRILGASKNMKVPNSATWIVSGNNLEIAGDIPRRCYRIRLDAKMSLPFLGRDFKHPNLIEWASTERGELLAAIFIVARAWIRAGRPAGLNPIIGSFESWSQVIGGILHRCGIKGFLANACALYKQANELNLEWEGFLMIISAWFGEKPFTVAELVARANQEGETEIPIPSDLPSLADARALGNAFRTRVDTRYGESGVHILRVGSVQGYARWAVALGV
jgi:hypothetical protein